MVLRFVVNLLSIHSSIAIILMGKRELVALLNLSTWCLVMVEWLFLAVPWGCLRFVIVVFPDHTHLLFMIVSIPDLCTVTNFNFQYRKFCVVMSPLIKDYAYGGSIFAFMFYLHYGPSNVMSD